MHAPCQYLPSSRHCRAVSAGRSKPPVPRPRPLPAAWRSVPAALQRCAAAGGSGNGGSEGVSASEQEKQQQAQQQKLECTLSGMDSVECAYVDGEESSTSSSTTTTTSMQQRAGLQLSSPLSLALLISPFAFWGTSMVAMKGLMTVVPPLLMGSFRLLPAGMILVAWAAAQGRPQPSTLAAWAWVGAFALVDGAAFQGFLAEGLQRCTAGLGSVIIDSQPLSVALLAALLFGEALTPTSVAGLAIGVVGLLLLELPEDSLADATGWLSHVGSDSAEAAVSGAGASLALPSLDALASSGELWMLAAAQAMAVGTVMVRFVTKHADPVMATGWHMVLGGLVLLALAVHEEPSAIDTALQGLGPQDVASALYVSLLGGAASYGIFFWQASSQGNLTALSSLTFLTPVFAAVTGYLVLDEVLTWPQLLGGAVTLSAVFLLTAKQSPAPSKSKQP